MKRRTSLLALFFVLGLLVAACSPTPLPVTVIPTPVQVALTRGPYLQSVTPTAVIIVWETDEPSPGTVIYGEEAGDYSRLAHDPQVGIHHVVTLTGLSPYTAYHYQVQASAPPLGDGYTFRTAAGPDQDRFTFAAFGDTRSQEQFHQAVVDLIVSLEPDFVLHTGDLVAHGYSDHEWNTFFEIEQELMARAPLFPALGNHEGNAALYYDFFYLPGNERWYSFDYGHAHFVCLQADNLADLSPEGEQVRWLRADLEATDRPWKFAFFHVPPYSSLYREENDVRVQEVLAPILAEHGVQMVFNGHDHGYQRLVVDDVTYLVTAGGGAPLYTLPELHPALVAHAVEYHTVLVTLDGPTLTAVAISATGEELDRFTLELP